MECEQQLAAAKRVCDSQKSELAQLSECGTVSCSSASRSSSCLTESRQTIPLSASPSASASSSDSSSQQQQQQQLSQQQIEIEQLRQQLNAQIESTANSDKRAEELTAIVNQLRASIAEQKAVEMAKATDAKQAKLINLIIHQLWDVAGIIFAAAMSDTTRAIAI